MMKGISFDGIHSHGDLNLVLSSINIPPAQPKLYFIDIPYGDGSVDVTEALGEVNYNDREATIVFTVMPQDDFEAKKQEVSNLLNGVRFDRIIVDKDPNYYWTGRCKVNEYASDKNIHQIVVIATLAPYKTKVKETVVTAQAGVDVAVKLDNSRRTVTPTITTEKNATIVFDTSIVELNAGTNIVSGLRLKYGRNTVMVTSEAPVVFTYQEGDL